jgi:hypothetical protein
MKILKRIFELKITNPRDEGKEFLQKRKLKAFKV